MMMAAPAIKHHPHRRPKVRHQVLCQRQVLHRHRLKHQLLRQQRPKHQQTQSRWREPHWRRSSGGRSRSRLGRPTHRRSGCRASRSSTRSLVHRQALMPHQLNAQRNGDSDESPRQKSKTPASAPTTRPSRSSKATAPGHRRRSCPTPRPGVSHSRRPFPRLRPSGHCPRRLQPRGHCPHEGTPRPPFPSRRRASLCQQATHRFMRTRFHAAAICSASASPRQGKQPARPPPHRVSFTIPSSRQHRGSSTKPFSRLSRRFHGTR